MKRFLPLFSFAVIMAACNQSPKFDSQAYSKAPVQQAPAVNPDTVGLAKFQQWQAENEMADVQEYYKPEIAVAKAAPVKKAAVKKQVAPVRSVAKASAPVRKAAPVATRTSSNRDAETATSGGSGTGVSNEGGSANSETAHTAEAPAKEGWSKAAKGAVIGAAGGAAAGAVVNKKNRAVGAVIGAVIGAGGGYVVGRKQDKKDGRY
jgi:hypothetical protein